MQRLIWPNFVVSVWLWVAWWAWLFVGEVARGGNPLHPGRAGDVARVYGLLVVVQALLWVTFYRGVGRSERAGRHLERLGLDRGQVEAVARGFAGILGLLMLSILGALAWKSLFAARRVHCLSVTNEALLSYIGLSHLGFAAFGRGGSAR